LLFIPYVFIVYLVAQLSYSFFEIRFIKMKDKFFTKKNSIDKSEQAVGGLMLAKENT